MPMICGTPIGCSRNNRLERYKYGPHFTGPAALHEKLLDFPSIPKWHTSFIKSITPLDTESDDPLAAGKKLHCETKDFTFDSTITKNTPYAFVWQGPPVMTVSGLHSFTFEPSKSTSDGTTFIQQEEYSGGISFLMQPWLLGRAIKGQFGEFNEDLKKRAESIECLGQ